MNVSINQTTSEIQTELREIFRDIVLSSEIHKSDEFVLDYYGYDHPYEKKNDDSGKVVIGFNDTSTEVSYAYRVRYGAKSYEQDKIYWYTEESGLCDLGVLRGETGNILSTVHWCNQADNNVVSDEKVRSLESLFDILNRTIKDVRERHSIEDIASYIRNGRGDLLRNVIAPDDESSIEVWKLLFSKDDQDNTIANDVSIEYMDSDCLLARSVRSYFDNKVRNQYPIGLVVEKRNNSFNFHRIRRDKRLDDRDYDWDEYDIRELLGYELDVSQHNVETFPESTTVRVTDDLCILRLSYQDEYRRFRTKAFYDSKLALHRTYVGMYRDALSTNSEEEFHISSNKARIRNQGLDFNDSIGTEEAKDVQEEIGIDETRIRKIQEKRDIKRLSSNLRCEILSDVYLEDFLKWISNRNYQELHNYKQQYNEEHYSNIERFSYGDIAGFKKIDEFADLAVNNPEDISYRTVYDFCNYITNKRFTSEKKPLTKQEEDYTLKLSQANTRSDRGFLYGYDDRVIETFIVPNRSGMTINKRCRELGRADTDIKLDDYSWSTSLDRGVYQVIRLDCPNGGFF